MNLKSPNKRIMQCAFKYIICLLIIIFLILLFAISIKEDTSEGLVRSTSLQRVVTKGDSYDRIDYVDEKGNITYAADKHYATLIRIKEENQVLDKYYDTDGEQTKQNLGYYSILRLYNQSGQEYKTVYLDINGEPMTNRAGYAIVERTYNQEGKIETELYYDENEAPIETNLLGYGCRNEYDDKGRIEAITYLGLDGEPDICGQGYAIVHKTYYEEGEYKNWTKNEYYYDEKGKPIRLSIGQYGLHREYDKEGRINLYTYLGIDGLPTITTNGYTTIKRTYYNDDSVKCDMYYDINGNPIALSEGQYGVLRKEGRSVWLDINGKEKQSFHNLIFGSKWFSLSACLIVVFISSFTKRNNALVILSFYVLFVIYLTLMKRTENAWGVNLTPLWSYRQVLVNQGLATEILNNILLFIPLTALMYRIYPKRTIILLAFLLSLLIELIQYCLHIGLCEIDDVISNTLGGFIGYQVGKNFIIIRTRKKNNI